MPSQEELLRYIREYESLSNKSQIEWLLAKNILDDKTSCTVASEIPAAALKRPSGLILQWVIYQCAQHANDIPDRLCQSTKAITEAQAILFTQAWALWPETPVLTSQHKQAIIFNWLKPMRRAFGWVAIALINANNPSLAEKAILVWLHGIVDNADLDELLKSLLESPSPFPYLHKYTPQILRRATVHHRHNHPMLEKLCRIAFEAEYYSEAFRISGLFLSRNYECPPQIDAMHIAALAKLGCEDSAISGYQQRWYSEGNITQKFPYPHMLLPALTHPEKKSLQQHLLNNCELDPSLVPPWICLEKKVLQGRWKETIPKWFELLESRVQSQEGVTWEKCLVEDEEIQHLFLRLTEAIIQILPLRSTYISEVQQLWKNLAEIPEWKNLAEEMLVLKYLAKNALIVLEPDSAQRIQDYDRLLKDEEFRELRKSSNHWLAQYSARAYLKALVDRKLWSKLADFVAMGSVTSFRSVCTYEELYFFQRLADLEDKRVPREENQWDDWCNIWECLISLPLQNDQLCIAIDHFVLIRDSSRNNPIIRSRRFHDLTLQLERRGKAVAEALLHGTSVAQDSEWRKGIARRLRNCSLDGISQIIQEIER